MKSEERFVGLALDLRKAPDSTHLHGGKSIRLRQRKAAGIAARSGWQPLEYERKSQTGNCTLLEKEAASGGEVSWIAKQRLWAHNPGSLRAMAVTRIRR
jgi:hypothetical protein